MVQLQTLQIGDKFKAGNDSTVYELLGFSMDSNQAFVRAPYGSQFSTWSKRMVIKITQ